MNSTRLWNHHDICWLFFKRACLNLCHTSDSVADSACTLDNIFKVDSITDAIVSFRDNKVMATVLQGVIQRLNLAVRNLYDTCFKRKKPLRS